MKFMSRSVISLVLTFFATLCATAFAADAVDVAVDCTKITGEIRALNGVNNGTLDGGGLVDLSAPMSALSIPLVRLHDVHWPVSDVVDMHVVFPNSNADPSKPESYDFTRTDEYIASIVKLGPKIVYRLGESIEHHKEKRFVHPPADPAKWAAACLGIVRHYNDGWANGFHHGIAYWEIWNEPENRPAMWTGDDAQYFELYVTASKALKEAFPNLHIGGPAIGYAGELKDGQLVPTPFLSAFLDRVREQKAPFDFFSWHIYSKDPAAPARLARAVRTLLDGRGFTKTESHLNEWNYIPDNGWQAVMLEGQGIERQRWYERQGGAEGAAFIAGTLMSLQDVPLDSANFYRGDTGGFGLFTPDAVPKKAYFAFKAFAELLKTPRRLSTNVGEGVIACAGAERDGSGAALRVLISTAGGEKAVHVRLEHLDRDTPMDYAVMLLDADHELAEIGKGAVDLKNAIIELSTKGPAVVLVKIQPPAAR